MSWEPFIWGGAAAIVAEAFTYPLDTSKTRLQIQGQTADTSLSAKRYQGMCHTITTVAKEEGMGALMKGVRFAFLRQATYGTLRLGAYYNMKAAWERKHGKMPLAYLMALGSGVGVVGAYLTTPAEVLRVRAQVTKIQIPQPKDPTERKAAHINHRVHTSESQSIFQGLIRVYQSEGLRGLYRGAVPNGQRAGVVNGIEIPTYDVCKRWVVSRDLADNQSTVVHLVCSVCAGVMSSVSSQPIDVARTRMMYQRVHGGHKTTGDVRLYRGVVDTIYQTVKYEGVLALWKGLTPSLCRLIPWNMVFFITFEQLKRMDDFVS